MNKAKQLLPFYEFAIDNVSVGIHAIDVTGKTILYNAKMKEIEGFHFDEPFASMKVHYYESYKQVYKN